MPPQQLSEWADDNYYLSAGSSNEQGPWESLPYQRGIMNAISNDEVEVMSWQKAARLGYTKIITAATGYFAAHKSRNVVIYQPTDSDSSDFSETEVAPMCIDVKPVRDKLKCHPEKKSKDNTKEYKRFIGSTLHIRGGKSARNFRRLTKDVVFYDELDGFDDDVDGEGDPVKLGDVRISNSSFPKSIRGSTPKTTHESKIERSISEADLTVKRRLPCPSCTHLHVLEWRNFDIETSRFNCPECKDTFGYEDYREMDEKGVWADDDGNYIDETEEIDVLRDSEHKEIEWPHHIGFFIWSAYSYFHSWSLLAREWRDAQKALKMGDKTPLKTFINTRLAETYEDVGKTVDDSLLYKRREHYKAQVPDNVLVLTAGCDVQDDRVEFEICGWGPGEESYSIDYVVLHGNLSRIEIWDRLSEQLKRQFAREDGAILDVMLACIDSGGHYTDEVYQFSKDRGPLWAIPVKGANVSGKPVAEFPKKPNKKGVYLTMIGTDTAKEIVYDRYDIDKPGPGYCHFPVADAYNADHFKQLVSEEKRKKFYRGRLQYEWHVAKGKRNEPSDCRVYNLAAIRLLQQQRRVNLLKEYRDSLVKRNEEKKPKPRVRRTGFARRF